MTTATSTPRGAARGATIVITAVWMVVVNAQEAWRPLLGGLVTPAFTQVLWAINLACAVQMFTCAVLLVHEARWLQRLADAANAAAAVVSALVFWRVFPLELSGWGAWVEVTVRVLLILGVVGGSVGAVVNLARLALGGELPPPAPRPSHP
ncbi:MAG: hypothetical protein AMXMBFR34_12390 [Myxococcaceae bacterium]